MMNKRVYLLILLGLIAARAISADGPRIPSFERYFSQEETDLVRGGMLLLGELNCVACHTGEPAWGILAKQAPRLDQVGDRVRPEFLRQFLVQPSQVDPGTTMPHLLRAGSDGDRARQVESLVHFLASTGKISESAPVSAGVNRGQRLFHTIGCVACHDPQPQSEDGSATELATSVPLAGLSRKYSIPALANFLRDPLEIRPSGRMPQLNLTTEEARDVACFLLRDLEIPSSMTFQYFEGSWETLPDFDLLPVKASGGASSFDVNVGAADHFGIRFQGKFRVDTDGQYRFFLGSDDGSRLIIDGREVLANDGIHAMAELDAKVPLSAGEHNFVVEYFEGGGEQELRVEYQGQGTKRQSLEFALVAPESTPNRPRFEPDATLAREGQELFQRTGCAACHEIKIDGQRLSPTGGAKKMSELASGGCLAEQPPSSTPDFRLSQRQRSALERAIEVLRSGKLPWSRPAEQVAHAMTAFNCYACHERGGTGGVEDARNTHFRSNQPEMGDEGRIPPSLNGVGAKLKPASFERLLERGAKDRPYMFTRMPRFGSSNVGTLVEQLNALDRALLARPAPDAPALPSVPERRLKAIGRQLVGDRGMSCVKCHTWGKVPATGIQAIDLTTMTRRLDEDWFSKYLINPQIYRPGTRMPAAWPNGESPFANLLDGSARHQIHAVWSYLSDGNDAAMPAGIGQQPIELVADNEPILYRNFLDGVGTRGIAVGYPERVNLAFDANECRLALIWQGAFLDASMHWTGRGQGFQKPLGDNQLSLAAGIPLAVLPSLDGNWPQQPTGEQAVTFRGYRLDEQRRPIFLYAWRGAEFEDAMLPESHSQGIGLRRVIRISGPVPNQAWFRAALGKTIEEAASGEYVVADDWRLNVRSSGGKPMIRRSPDRLELLAPIPAESNASVIELFYRW